MNSSTLRRLASDQASLRRATPPNYLFPPTLDNSSLPDDLTQLTILVTGAQGTAYSQGLWRLHLSMPDDYPKSPPKATFKTRIYHPNVEESTGAVCLDTLKKDWQSKLTLRDILITISCLLIHPNPDSALNSAAGALLQDDYDAFAKQARLMTSIHAPIPPDLKDAVLEAKRIGEERGSGPHYEAAAARATAPRASSIATSAVRKNQTESNTQDAGQENDNNALLGSLGFQEVPDDHGEDDNAKENDPSHSPSLALLNHESSRRNVLGKRPLSELPTPIDPDSTDSNILVENYSATCIEEKAPPSQPPSADNEPSSEPLKKSPKLDISARSLNTYGRVRQEDCSRSAKAEHSVASTATDLGDDKENMQILQTPTSSDNTKATAQQTGCQAFEHPQRPTLRKVSNVGSSRLKGQARVGIRRL